MRALAILLVFLASVLPATAGDDIPDQPVTAEVLSGWTLKDGRRMAGLRLVLAPGWKTYWRVPGEAGIPPQFDWSGAGNVANIQVKWPTPQVFYEYGMRSYGYKQTVVLPLVIQTRGRGPVRLKGDMELGVCADVCLPYRLRIDATLAEPAARPTPEIAAALASMPYSASEGDVRQAICRIAPSADGMRVEARVTLPTTGGTELAVIEAGVPDIWVSDARTKRQGDTLVAVSEMMHVDGGSFSVERSRMRITILGEDYAVDIEGCRGS